MNLNDAQRAALALIADKADTYRSGIVPARSNTFSVATGRALARKGLVHERGLPHKGFRITDAGRALSAPVCCCTGVVACTWEERDGDHVSVCVRCGRKR